MSSQDKREKQEKEIYESYGRFAIEFEQMCLAVKRCIISSLHYDGLKEQQFIHILLADQTAYPLITKLRSVVSVIYKDKPSVMEHLSKLFIYSLKVIEKRNEIIHGAWFVGWGRAGQEEFNVASGHKHKITSNGWKSNDLFYEFSHFDELTNKVVIAKGLFERLSGCLAFGMDIINNIDKQQIEKTNIAS